MLVICNCNTVVISNQFQLLKSNNPNTEKISVEVIVNPLQLGGSDVQEGDPKYMAPELMQGRFGKSADIFRYQWKC